MLEDFFLQSKNHKLKMKQITSFYEKNGISLDDKTIRADLNEISTCSPSDNFYWILNSSTQLNYQKKQIHSMLKHCTIYHPVQHVNTLELDVKFEAFENPKLELYSIFIQLNSRKPNYYLEKLLIDLGFLYKLEKKDLNKSIWSNEIIGKRLQLTFNDREKLIEMYSLINQLKQSLN